MRVWVPFPEVVASLPPGLEADIYDGTGDPPSTMEEVEFYVLPYTFSPATLTIMAGMPRLRVVQSLTAGYEHLLPFLPDGVRLCVAGGVHDTSTAELAVALTLASLRGFPALVRAQSHGEWAHARYESLADKRVLLVGYGGIGSAVERRLAGFELASLRRVARRAREGISPTSELPALLPDADVVILALPLDSDTRGMVDAAFLARLPDHALVVNVARGGIVDTEALLTELRRGRLRAALDVTDPEPLPHDHPLWHAPGVLLSPHVGGNTTAFRPRAVRLVQEQLRRYVAGESLPYDVTPAR